MDDLCTRPRKILFINTPNGLGGAEFSLLTLMKNLDAERYVPHLVTAGPGSFYERARDLGIPVSVCSFPWFSRRQPWQYAWSVCQLAKLIRYEKVALIHSNCDHSLPYVEFAAKLARVPYVSHVRDFVRAWFEPAKLRALKSASCVIAVSSAMAHACLDAGLAQERVIRIYNPVEIDAFRTAPSDARGKVRADLGIGASDLVIGTVGQLHPLKGQDVFVKAALRVSQRIPNAVFVVVGTALSTEQKSFERHLWDLVAENRLTSQFRFIGFRHDVPLVMRAMDILVVPSLTESFGRVAVEGMASGLPVVASACGGIEEIVDDGVNGLLISPGDVDGMAGTILKLWAQPDLRASLGSAGLLKARTFDVEFHVHQMQAVYDAVVE